MYGKKLSRNESGVIVPPMRKESNYSIDAVSRKQSRVVGEAIPRESSDIMRKCSAPLLGCRCLGPCRLKALQLDCGMNLFMLGVRKQSRTFVHASKPRVSNITFSTVTSATGLPTIAAEPQHRSSNYWKSSDSSSSATCTCSKTASTCVLHHSTNETTKSRRRFSSPTAEKPNSATQNLRNVSEPDTNIGTLQTNNASITKESSPNLLLNDRRLSNNPSPVPIPSPVSGGVSPSNSSLLSSTPTFVKSSSSIAKSPSPSVAFIQEEEPEDLSEEDHDTLPTTTKQLSQTQTEKRSTLYVDPVEVPDNQLQVIKTKDGLVFDCTEIEKDPTLRRITEWSFPIFHFSDRYKQSVLSRLTYSIFKQADLFNIFKISPVKFFNFFHALEMRYWEIPYHNRIHAADVLHACHYLICHPVRAFLGRPQTPVDEDVDDGIEPLSFGPILDSAPLPIAGSMSALELMALYTAASAHDVDHPGRTNAFLVAAEDRKAILYNDRSVLENHHAAESWRILSQTQNNFIESLDSAETKRFRYLVLEYILATDLKQHFDIIMSFNDKAAEMDLTSEADRVLVSQMLIKFADINSPAKPFSLHRQWTDRICQEFYEQGDEEKRRNMPISPYMDRNYPSVAKLQDSFIAHIVNPLVMALNEAGLLPVLPGLEESEILINLKHNHHKWLIEIDEQQKLLDEDVPKNATSSEATTMVEIEQKLKQQNLSNTQINRPNGTLNKTCVEEDNTSQFECCAVFYPTRATIPVKQSPIQVPVKLSHRRLSVQWPQSSQTPPEHKRSMSVEAGQNNQSDVENASRSSWIRRLPSWRPNFLCAVQQLDDDSEDYL